MYEYHWSSSRTKIIEIDFDKVETGKTAIKSIEIWNECCKEQSYEVQRDPTTNPLDHVFHLRCYTWTLAPQEKFMCDVRYRPFVPFSTNVDYFNIQESSGASLKVIARGSSIGPEVFSSSTRVVMHCTNENRDVKKRIKLTNSSDAIAIFMFDVDEKYQFFKLDTSEGTIKPHSHKYITITFSPPGNGKYTYHIPCLILHQDPIIIEVYGYCGSKKDDLRHINYPWEMKTGFAGYMNYSINTKGNLPPISLSEHYFNFAQADVDTENILQRIPQTICLTNHNQSNILVKWDKDDTGMFYVTPCTMHMRGNQSALFEIIFNPNVKGNLFGREIVGSIFMENADDDDDEEELITFPFVTSVRVIGHSFPIGSYGWIPQYEIPPAVIMPPCVPPYPVYTTFLIKKFGHLPLMFHFVAPAGSRFTVKPMMGVIHKDYQIIALEMSPKPENEQIYVERWAVYFNANKKNECCIDFKGYAECPNMNFNNNNVVVFAPTYPGCQQFEQVSMRNITRHAIKYQFHEVPSALDIQRESGEINSNDILSEKWSFCPKESNKDYDFEVQCHLMVIKGGCDVGPKVCIVLRILGRSEIGFLVAVPSEISFGDQEYNASKSRSFYVFNFSPVNIYYKMVCTHRNWPIGDIEKDVEIRPISETVFPGAHEKITVSITPRTPGYYEFIVQYFVRVNFHTDTLIPDQTPRNICYVSSLCILPTVEVTNLCFYGSFPNVSRPSLWKSMKIDALNKILKNMLPGDKPMFNIYPDPMLVNEGFVFIELILRNPTRISVSCNVRRRYCCSCKPVVKKKGLSFYRMELNCIHENLCTVYPKSLFIKSKQEAIMTIKLQYTLFGKSEVGWDLDIGHDRHISLRFIIKCLSGCERELHLVCGAHLNFGMVYFGNRHPICKTQWIRNNTDHSLSYFIDATPLCKINYAYHCRVFSCLTQSGAVNPRSSLPIIFQFHPRMFGAYKVVLPVTLGDTHTELILEGESSFDFRLKVIGKSLPELCTCEIREFPVYFSTDCIDIWSIGTHNSVVKMLLVHNGLKNDALAFEWKSPDVANILHVQVYPRKGVIQRRSVQSFHVVVYTNGHPYAIDVSIPCEFFNASQRRQYQRSVLKRDMLCDELEGQFIITEKGIDVPKPTLKLRKPPEVFYKVLTLRCSILGPEDEILKTSLSDELKNTPRDAVYTEKKECKNTVIEEKGLCISLFILECLLWDILNSRSIKRIIQECLVLRSNLYYSQFQMNLAERKKLVKRSYISPPWVLIDAILEKILFIIVHEEYSLKTTHLVPDEDIRHANYLKMIAREERRSTHEDYFSLYDKDLSYKKEKPTSSVSFLE